MLKFCFAKNVLKDDKSEIGMKIFSTLYIQLEWSIGFSIKSICTFYLK